MRVKNYLFFVVFALLLHLNGSAMVEPKALLEGYLQTMYGKSPGFQIEVTAKIPAHVTLLEDGFMYQTHKRKIKIYAQNQKAQTYAVYRILEEVFGYDYLCATAIEAPSMNPTPTTDATLTKIRNDKKIILERYLKDGLPTYSKVCNPAFTYREIFYGECRKGIYPSFHALSNTGETAFEKHPGWGMWVHTLHKLVPPNMYFSTHPEYYAYRNGQRINDQLCMSSKEVVNIVIQSLRTEMAKNPEATYWSVSQMDNYNYCECDQCHKIDEEEGSHAGSIIRFVNEVAKQFPDKIISTLAYQYSRSAPKITRPEPNVNIMLCTIESDRAKPITDSDFERDLSNWAALTKEILIWDYVINFSHLISPFPNWHVLAPNLSMFQKYGCKMVFEQGLNQVGGEMEPMRAWILAKLVWDPTLNADSLRVHFAKSYYGDAAPEILEILMLQMEALLLSGKPLTLYEPPATHINGYLHPELLLQYHQLIQKALDKTSGNLLLQERIHMVQQSVFYAILECMKLPTASNSWILNGNKLPSQNSLAEGVPNYAEILDSLTYRAERYGPSLFHEVRLSPKEYRARTLHQWNNTLSTHLAKNKPVLYIEAPNKSYRAGSTIELNKWLSQQSINNGLKGDLDYQFNWNGWWGKNAEINIDLQEEKLVQEIRIQFLENSLAWIVGPSKLRFEKLVWNAKDSSFSSVQTDEITNPKVGQKIPEGVYPLQLKLLKPTTCRYLKITVENPGKLPTWRGVNDNGWLFIDEVEVF